MPLFRTFKVYNLFRNIICRFHTNCDAGSQTYLSDPQIITSPYVFYDILYVGLISYCHSDLGPLFASGNVNFDFFVEEHKCNAFCRHFRLPQVSSTSKGVKLFNSGSSSKEKHVLDIRSDGHSANTEADMEISAAQ